jgi:hypothetical protein
LRRLSLTRMRRQAKDDTQRLSIRRMPLDR